MAVNFQKKIRFDYFFKFQFLKRPVDPLIDFDLINNPKQQIKAVEPDFNMNLFENEDNMYMDLFNPNNLLKEEKNKKLS